MISWSIDENKGYELTGETVFGLTSTHAQGQSVISYVGFSSDLKRTQQELNVEVGVAAPSSDAAAPQSVYAPDGTPRNHLVQGINIVGSGNHYSKVYCK